MRKPFTLFAAMLLLALSASRADAAFLALVPAHQFASPPDIVIVDLVAFGLTAGGPPSIGDFDVDVFFDPGALTFLGYSLSSSLGDPFLGEAVDFSLGEILPGVVNLAEVSLLEADGITCVFCIGPFLDDIQPDAFVLATLGFEVHTLAPGDVTVLSFEVSALGDGFGLALPFEVLGFAMIEAPLAVAEPWTATLLALGLLAMAGARRRAN